ncbi:MAG: aminotransferase class V-fold PLP-dependent enzyme [Bacillota bacterium]|nr:aminotransferase class V-fold PLP-dependent enzyme [Bacillota bacterium]
MIYLDNAAGSHPKPPQLSAALTAALDRYGANPGRGNYRLSRETAVMLETVRERLTAFFGGTDSRRMVFTSGATAALNMAIYGLMRPGQELIISGAEHNAVYRPAAALADSRMIKLLRAPADRYGYVPVEEFARRISPRTGLLACVHASNVCGAVQPVERLAELAAQRRLPLLIDAAQTAGLADIRLDRLPGRVLLAFPAHKALYGIAGLGGLYVSLGVDLRPLLHGGTGTLSEQRAMPAELPQRLEAGSLNTPAVAALGAALDFVAERGVEQLYAQARRLADLLAEKLGNIPRVRLQLPPEPRPRMPVLSLTIDGICANQAADWLDADYDIAVRAGYHCAPLVHKALGTWEEGTLRISPGCFNSERDIEQTARAIAAIAKRV